MALSMLLTLVSIVLVAIGSLREAQDGWSLAGIITAVVAAVILLTDSDRTVL